MIDTHWDELLPENTKPEIVLKAEEILEGLTLILQKYHGLSFHIYSPMAIIEEAVNSARDIESLGRNKQKIEKSWQEYDDLVSQLYIFIENQSIPLNMVLSAEHVQVINECIAEIEATYPQYSITIKDSEELESEIKPGVEMAYLALNVGLVTSLADN